MANLSTILAATLSLTDTVLTPSPQDVTYSFNNPTFTGTASYFQAFFQAGTSATTVPLPMATCPVFIVVNRDATNNLTVSFTVTGPTTDSVVLTPGSALVLFNTANTQGVTAATLTSGGAAAISAMVFAAG